MIKVAVFGARGRMGAEVCRAVQAADGLELVAAIDLSDDREPAKAATVAVDFTQPDAVLDNLAGASSTASTPWSARRGSPTSDSTRSGGCWAGIRR